MSIDLTAKEGQNVQLEVINWAKQLLTPVAPVFRLTREKYVHAFRS